MVGDAGPDEVPVVATDVGPLVLAPKLVGMTEEVETSTPMTAQNWADNRSEDCQAINSQGHGGGRRHILLISLGEQVELV